MPAPSVATRTAFSTPTPGREGKVKASARPARKWVRVWGNSTSPERPASPMSSNETYIVVLEGV